MVNCQQGARSRARARNGARHRGSGDRRVQAGRPRRREGGRCRRRRGDAARLQRPRIRRHRRDRRGRARRGADALYRREGRQRDRHRPEDRHRARSAGRHDASPPRPGPTRSRCWPSPRKAACSTRPTSIWTSSRSGRAMRRASSASTRTPTENIKALAAAKGVAAERDHRLRARSSAPRGADRRAARASAAASC